ncbi:MAG: hypothetical protein KC656_23755, partial [Myxococcales bacterium]|nr:hypothetical protein [Myxococcales bacterium]
MDRRLGRGAYLASWLVLAGAQLALLANMENTAVPEAGGLPVATVLVAMGVLQLLKFPTTAWRLNDLGRPPSDAVFFVLLPVGNLIGFLRYMVEATPSDKVREARARG